MRPANKTDHPEASIDIWSESLPFEKCCLNSAADISGRSPPLCPLPRQVEHFDISSDCDSQSESDLDDSLPVDSLLCSVIKALHQNVIETRDRRDWAAPEAASVCINGVSGQSIVEEFWRQTERDSPSLCDCFLNISDRRAWELRLMLRIALDLTEEQRRAKDATEEQITPSPVSPSNNDWDEAALKVGRNVQLMLRQWTEASSALQRVGDAGILTDIVLSLLFDNLDTLVAQSLQPALQLRLIAELVSAKVDSVVELEHLCVYCERVVASMPQETMTQSG